MNKQVYILTWCNEVENLYGTTLTFKTLRVGFPSARVHVVDNASLSDCRPLIRQGAQECGAEFVQMEQGIAHHDFVERVLNTQPEGTAIFVDPDVCFWENVEGWKFDALMAGRRLPKFACELTGCVTHPRLHTSFLWIPNVCVLRDAILTLRGRLFEFQPFRPVMFRLDGVWQRFDTGASLFSGLPEEMHCFTDRELEAYDHLFCGTHLGRVAPALQPEYADQFKAMHKEVQTNPGALKGAWRIQEDYLKSRAV